MPPFSFYSKSISLFLIIVFLSSCTVIPSEVSTAGNFSKIFYYGRSTLSPSQKKAYDYIFKNARDWSTASVGESSTLKLISFENTDIKITKDELMTIILYIQNDHSELFPMHIVPRDIIQGTSVHLLSFKFRYQSSPKYPLYLENMQDINREVHKILAKITPSMSEYQIAKLLHDELLKIVSYGGISGIGYPGDLRGAFILNKIVCEGYSFALNYLYQKAGLESIYILGDFIQEDGEALSHAWNKVKIDNKWYNVDSTWDDAKIPGSSNVYYHYFLLGDPTFEKDHKPTVGWSYNDRLPKGSSTDYPMDRK